MSTASPATTSRLTTPRDWLNSGWRRRLADWGRNMPAWLISVIVHAALLASMALYTFHVIRDPEVASIATIVDEQPIQPDFQQDLQLDTTVSDQVAVDAGGLVASEIGASEPLSQSRLEQSEAIREPEFRIATISDISVANVLDLGRDLGERQVLGESAAHVPGYRTAMSRLTLEFLRHMRQQPVTAVWLFDASLSLKDDREEISKNFHKVYEELRISQARAEERGAPLSPLQTMVYSFGQGMERLLPAPTDDLDAIRKSIRAIKTDKTGVEHTYAAIGNVLDEFGPTSNRQKRKLAIVVVTDETGDDDALLESVIARARRYAAPVYFLSREAVFGYPYVRIRWTHPDPPNLTFWIDMDRGPETALPELLQYDGLHERWDSASSGFGPYGQARLARESGGILFLLAGKEENLAGRDGSGPRKFSDLRMKQYEPQLLSRDEYEKQRRRSEFRETIWNVIVSLNPHLQPELKLKRHHYSIDRAKFSQEGREQFQKCLRTLAALNEGIRRLERIEPLRAKEREPRWRANYDLTLAQLTSYRVRQFQFLLLLDKHQKEWPQPKDSKSNEWWLQNSQRLLAPDEAQVKATKIDLEELEAQKQRAAEMYDRVIAEHPGTPWARRAQQEKGWGFGFVFVDVFWHPEYQNPSYRAKIPNF